MPSVAPTLMPSTNPTFFPTYALSAPTPAPTLQPSVIPTVAPSSYAPTFTSSPSFYPTSDKSTACQPGIVTSAVTILLLLNIISIQATIFLDTLRVLQYVSAVRRE